ncbi:VWA_3 domain-containing protein [Cephalotus follicularis]|uniref:VWA_3 domain-containing protein n=1 Tax=Cephalotus follicularis TaxID=3775 RepID=A0A1Q3B0D7_CEPFO|nr:VWA_3 domain-containing protein [Cephalotus follicularis]
MAEEFSSCVKSGLNLSKRIYNGSDASPAPVPEMTRSSESYIPAAVTVYAMVPDPGLVDNPDVPSYQPYVHGKCEPAALIPLHMYGVGVEVECWLDFASVTVSGRWRVHCVMAGRRCDCLVAIPMGEQGSIIGIEVDIDGRSYRSQLITTEETEDKEKVGQSEENGRLLKGQIYTLKIPKVYGGSTLSIKATWSQTLSYQEGHFCLNVPFTFPAYVNPIGKMISKREKIVLNVNSVIGKEILCRSTSHPLKETRREVGKLGFLYEAEVGAWSNSDINFSYTVSYCDIFGGVLLQSPPLNDFDQRQRFCFYLFPGNNQSTKVFRKDVVFIVDISGSMRGGPLENTKNALLASLSKLNPQDSFNIIAFNGETYLFSSSMEPATEGAILNASQWLCHNLVAEGGTNIFAPLKHAMKLLSDTSDSIPLIFLITDGAVEDEREICKFVKGHVTSKASISPRISTFGIGLYCNHYFLQLLAQIGRGHFDSAYDADSVDFRMQRLFTVASSVLLANITFNFLKPLDSLELFPSHIPDLSFGSPLILSGRYNGNFPDSVGVSGILADMSNFDIDLKVRHVKDVPLDRVLARRQIYIFTAQAWLLESKELEDKVAKMSIQTRTPSEYTCMILHQIDGEKKAFKSVSMKELFNKINLLKNDDLSEKKTIFLGSLGIGFGNMKATADGIPPGYEEAKSPEGAELLMKAASNCCGRLVDRCCCMCFIQACSHMNDKCSIALSQLCAALACFGCISCCFELCECI